MTLGDRVVVMKDGWIQQVGEPLELYGQPANRFVAGFIGSPSMNFRRGDSGRCERRPVGGYAGAWAEGATGRARAGSGRTRGQRVTLGIRPEDLRVATGSDSADFSFDTVGRSRRAARLGDPARPQGRTERHGRRASTRPFA